jgi:hypothetical protein
VSYEEATRKRLPFAPVPIAPGATLGKRKNFGSPGQRRVERAD